jgi:hypothetical protein
VTACNCSDRQSLVGNVRKNVVLDGFQSRGLQASAARHFRSVAIRIDCKRDEVDKMRREGLS